MIDFCIKTKKISVQEVVSVEQLTRGQSKSEEWRNLKRTKLTASNFKSTITRCKDPNALLKRIMYFKKEEEFNSIA